MLCALFNKKVRFCILNLTLDFQNIYYSKRLEKNTVNKKVKLKKNNTNSCNFRFFSCPKSILGF